ncbi:MAG: leader peptidase (prepilin peptidase) / N-methyltransferase [Alphaproteobacteria bacterium]|nr:leader peptidase (prepilin peptidase) / N-methyltransferase [Alphaproteobacteria bacterium]
MIGARAVPSAKQPESPPPLPDPGVRSTRRRLAWRAAIALAALAACAASVAAAPGLRGVLGAGLAVVMLAIAVIDGRQFIIPNGLVAAGLALGFLHAGIADSASATEGVTDAAIRSVVLALVFLLIRFVYTRLRGREGIGLGDVKLAGVAGVWLDWPVMPLAVEIAALAALVAFGTRQWILGRPIRLSSRLPFGLFLAPAIWLCWYLDAMLLVPW